MECKYSLPCGLCDLKNTFCTMAFSVSKNSSSVISSAEYRNAIEYLKEIRALQKERDKQRYYDLAIEALQKERDKYFPGKWTKGGNEDE